MSSPPASSPLSEEFTKLDSTMPDSSIPPKETPGLDEIIVLKDFTLVHVRHNTPCFGYNSTVPYEFDSKTCYYMHTYIVSILLFYFKKFLILLLSSLSTDSTPRL
jgi:hypothetical protein